MSRVDLHPLAEQELTAVAVYYDEQARGLGADFLAEADRTLQFVVQYPGVGRQLPDSSRRVSLRRFPYHPNYRLDPDRLFVLAFAHDRRRPGYWSDRA